MELALQALRAEAKASDEPQLVHHGKHTFHFRTSRLEFRGHVNCAEAYLSLPEFGPDDKSEDWWRAQCAFRDLKADGTLESLQEQIRQNRNASMQPYLLQVEALLRSKYHWKTYPKKTRVGENTIEQLALNEPTDFLHHYFKLPSRNALILRVVAPQIRYATIALKLVSRVMDAPAGQRTKEPSEGNRNRWLAIGRSEHHIDQAIAQVRSRVLLGQSLAAGYGSVKNILPATKDVYSRKARSETRIKPMPRKVPTSQDSSPAIGRSGSEDNTPRGRRSSSTSMAPPRIYVASRSPSPHKRAHFMQQRGVHEPINVEGIWAIHCPELKACGSDIGDGLLCIKIDTISGTLGGDMVQIQVDAGREQEDDRFAKPNRVVPRFLMHRSELPSHTRREWAFAWRGEVAGRNKTEPFSGIQPDCKVIFGGTEGHELQGYLVSRSFGKFKFRGTRWSSQTKGVNYVIHDGWAHPAPQRLERYGDGWFIIPSRSLDIEWHSRAQKRHRRQGDTDSPRA